MRKAPKKRHTKQLRSGMLNYDEKQKRKTTLNDKVTHDYCDWSAVTPEDIAVGLRSPSIKFPTLLYMMLEKLQEEGNGIVHWQPHGRAFLICDREKFVQLLGSGEYFATTKIPSFQRQLNLYSFKRFSEGPDKHAYYHECFLRGKPFLLPLIQRSINKGVGVRLQPNPQDEPDFWNGPLPWVVDGKQQAKYHHAEPMPVPSSLVKQAVEQDTDEEDDDEPESIESRVIHDDESVTDNDSMTEGTSSGEDDYQYPFILHPFFETADLVPSMATDLDAKYPADVSLDSSVDVDSLEFGQPMSEFLLSD